MLDFHFAILQWIGLWCPVTWSGRKKLFYNIYTLIIVLMVSVLICLEMLQLIYTNNFKQFNDAFYIALGTFIIFYKGFCNLYYRKDVINLMKMFESELCIAQDYEEKDIIKKCEARCRKVVITLLVMLSCSLVLMNHSSIVFQYTEIERRKLPYKIKVPYDLKNPYNYWPTAVYEIICCAIMATTTMTNNGVIVGFMSHICAQFEILRCRLDELPRKITEMNRSSDASKVTVRDLERKLLIQHINHHQLIFRITDEIVNIFRSVIALQYYISILNIITVIFQLAVRSSNFSSLSWFLSLLCIRVTESFVYCYFGNEVREHSIHLQDKICGINWTSLSLRSRRDLLFMIHRSSKPISILDGTFIQLNLTSFVNILKTAYSTYNLLKTMSE